GDAERKQVQEVLDTGVLMRYGFDGMRQGNFKAREFERALALRMQTAHAQLVSSGTAAITIALASAGVGAGDEVILPTFTFVASFEAVLALGAVPILADVDATLTLDPLAVEKAISDKTRAVMPVHMCGSMANLGALKSICEQHNLILLEDACQAIGGSYDGKPLGSVGDMGVFSFDYVKTITCGEGGAIITNNQRFYKNSDHYSDHGHDHIGNDRGAEGHPFLGYNYRISELNAAVGLAQIARLDEFLEIQRKNYSILREALEVVPEVVFRKVPEGGIENYSFLSFFMPSEEGAKKVHTALSEAGIEGCFYWYDNNWHYYRKWEHLTDRKSLGKLPQEILDGFQDFPKMDFSQSDHWVGRNISCLIKLSWTGEEVKKRAKKMAETIGKII
ncbi:MAG: DegT/DnrJ/EryC1/StrS family aminotransferase, partial [Aurantibacter sp.]